MIAYTEILPLKPKTSKTCICCNFSESIVDMCLEQVSFTFWFNGRNAWFWVSRWKQSKPSVRCLECILLLLNTSNSIIEFAVPVFVLKGAAERFCRENVSHQPLLHLKQYAADCLVRLTESLAVEIGALAIRKSVIVGKLIPWIFCHGFCCPLGRRWNFYPVAGGHPSNFWSHRSPLEFHSIHVFFVYSFPWFTFWLSVVTDYCSIFIPLGNGRSDMATTFLDVWMNG